MNVFSGDPARLTQALNTLRTFAALRGHVVVDAEVERALSQAHFGSDPRQALPPHLPPGRFPRHRTQQRPL